MGVDLVLLPLLDRDNWISLDILVVERREELREAVMNLPRTDVPRPISCYVATLDSGITGYGRAAYDKYGDTLRWVTASDLARLADHEVVQDNWQNRAAWAYLMKMPSDWPIVLFWN